MKPTKTIEEAHKYLIYISDALYNLSQKFSIDKQDRTTLETYASHLLEYSKRLEHLKNNMAMKEQMKKNELEKTEEK